MPAVPFQTRARTIDHLGREQIADCPTAISELWKNAYDAYSRYVELHIFDGEVPIAAVVDAGHGMSAEEFTDRWLTVGTEAKLDPLPVPESDRDGLPERPRQGQKGIGRLSVAHLGPVVMVLSKRKGHPFVVSLVDWRLFENPYLMLNDLYLPVETFQTQEEFLALRDGLFEQIVDNVWAENGAPERNARVKEAWAKLDHAEEQRGVAPSLSQRIVDTALQSSIEPRHLERWEAWTEEKDQGTALFVMDIYPELVSWVDYSTPREDEELVELRDRLKASLSAFVDPLAEQRPLFDYSMLVHTEDGERLIFDDQSCFDRELLLGLEHAVEGVIDKRGLFRGRLRAFGEDWQEIIWSPKRPPPSKGRGVVGSLLICLGTFEVDRKNTTHTKEIFHDLKKKARNYAGLGMYRDSLRLLPYGRPDSDFFEMEPTRGKHAGKGFWAHRRTFGRIAITRDGNPFLKDKAGREGLIDNKARRNMRLLVQAFLQGMSDSYFGTKSDLREVRLKPIQKRNNLAMAAEKQVTRRTQKALRAALKAQEPLLQGALEEIRQLLMEIKVTVNDQRRAALYLLGERVDRAQAALTDLDLPPVPKKLGTLEDRYRSYRDDLLEYRALNETLTGSWSGGMEALQPEDPGKAAESEFYRHQKHLTDALSRWKQAINTLLGAEKMRLNARIKADGSRYFKDAYPLVSEVVSGSLALGNVLNELDGRRQRLLGEFTEFFAPYVRALEQLSEEIDLDTLTQYSTEERQALHKQVQDLNALAQSGVTVEILGHELNDLDTEVSRNLRRLPQDCRRTEAYKNALRAHQTLAGRLRFLSPMNLAGPRLRQTVTGADIEAYLREFFGLRFERERVELAATPEFIKSRVTEYKARICPVFINLINNSLYWLHFAQERQIKLHRVSDALVVADGGQGVDPDDLDDLFQLFFTRKVNGRGVGLYLCRVNLAAGYHSIEYASEGHFRVLNGANFVIHFRGIK